MQAFVPQRSICEGEIVRNAILSVEMYRTEKHTELAVFEGAATGLVAPAFEAGMLVAVDAGLDAEFGARFVGTDAVWEGLEKDSRADKRNERGKDNKEVERSEDKKRPTVFAVAETVCRTKSTVVALNVALGMVLFVEDAVCGNDEAGMCATALNAFEVY
jgi:hypothetical protein